MLSIVSATLNSEKRIAVLIESLEAQTCKDFHWYVVDGGSKDRTVELVRCAGFADVFVLRDSSLYVALNEAIKRSKNRFYLVLGDDVDVINFNVLIDGVICSPRGGWLFWRGMQVFSPAHAVGMLIRKDLHFRPNLGLYDSSIV